jgi:hypothetical protein
LSDFCELHEFDVVFLSIPFVFHTPKIESLDSSHNKHNTQRTTYNARLTTKPTKLALN